jgi:hypothetical protein
LQQTGNPLRRITFHVHQQEYQPFGRGKATDRFFKVGPQDVAADRKVNVLRDRRGLSVLERCPLPDLIQHRRVYGFLVRFRSPLECGDERVLQQFLGLEFTAGHVVRHRKNTVPVTLIDVSLFLLEALPGHLACRHFRGVLFEIE